MDEDTSLYIITGPNMGGKSTYCRSVAIAFLMAQTGSFIAAASATLPIRDRLFARVGASDDLRGGQSTFMMEMNEVAHILHHATQHSLVILDEVGRGTGTYDGLSVAWAVSRYLATEIRAKTLFATHYLELTELAADYPEVKNLSLVVEEEGERIIFLHKILPGSANKSYGIHVARLAGLPEEVILGAGAKLSELEQDESAPVQYTSGSFADDTASPAENLRVGNVQMSFFAEAPIIESPLRSSAGKSREDKAIEDLKKKNISAMTPIDALNYLYKLQQTLKKDGAG
jgi:DNA mismatch repair protein MutS